MPSDRNQRAEITIAKTRAELAAAHAEIARLTAELTELRLNPPLPRRGNALPGKLTSAKINALIKEARETGRRVTIADSDNLGLQIIPGRKKTSVSWLFRWAERVRVGTNKHKSRAIGLGLYHNVDIDQARELAMHYRQLLQKNKDPRIEREKAICEEHNARESFKIVNQVADAYFSKKIAHLSISHRRKAEALLRPVRKNIGRMPIQQVTREIILADDGCGLGRMWMERNTSAVELKSHLDRMFRYAKTMGWFEGENPAAWREGLENILPKSKDVHKAKHHPSMPYQDVPDFILQLRAWRYRKTWHLLGLAGSPIPAYAVEMLIRTGVRTAEVQRARYNEFDLDTMVWKVPGFDEDGQRRTKNGEDHYIPITPGVAAIVQEMDKVRVDQSPNAFVFPAIRNRHRNRPIGPLGMQTLSRVLRNHLKLDNKFVNHGFRTTLRQWCGAHRYPDKWWDVQVGHKIGDAVSQAYPYGEQFEGRREMMLAWDNYCTTPKPKPKADNVITLDKRRSA